MIEITKIFEFSAAHYLPDHGGLCRNLHGHNYKLEVTIRGEIKKEGPERGMIMDFGNLKSIVTKAILDEFDHCNLNLLFSNPTAEIMVGAFAFQIQLCLHSNLVVSRVRLWETSTSYVTWRED